MMIHCENCNKHKSTIVVRDFLTTERLLDPRESLRSVKLVWLVNVKILIFEILFRTDI